MWWDATRAWRDLGMDGCGPIFENPAMPVQHSNRTEKDLLDTFKSGFRDGLDKKLIDR
jgi:hypothetical protein